MGKATEQAPPPVVSKDDEDPIWGDMLAGFFGGGGFATPSTALAVREGKSAGKPTRKQPKA
jgi:hypothetical protein